MLMLPRIAFVVLLVVVTAVIVATTGSLPDRVATHFGGGGLANGFMSRDGYLLFMLAFTIVIPLFVVAMTGLLPGIARSPRNIQHHDYWFAPARRAESSARLLNHACLLGCLMVLFFGGVHVALMVANAAVPPRLPETAFFVMLGAFLVGIAFWIFHMRRMFARPG
jgi:uncharacterized membrane protein